MNLIDWARREVELASIKERGNAADDEWDYGVACYESALKAYETLIDDGHSRMSFSITKNILLRLMNGLPLTAIEDVPEIWRKSYEKDGVVTFQCLRRSSLFKYVDASGKITYSDNDQIVGVDMKNGGRYQGGITRKIFDDVFGDSEKITMPYYPNSLPFVIFTEDHAFDERNGDYDTLYVSHVQKPNGEKIVLDKFFKEHGNEWVEISREEYEERVFNNV